MEWAEKNVLVTGATGLLGGHLVEELEKRNACVVAGNTGAHDCLDALARLAAHSSPLVRAHAVWAVRRLGADARLAVAKAEETDRAVLAEYATDLV